MDQIRPFPPTDFMDQAEEEEALRLIPAPDLKLWVVANFLTLGGPLHNPDHDHIAEMLHDNEGFLALHGLLLLIPELSVWCLANVKRLCFNKAAGRKPDKSSKCATGLDSFQFT